MIPSLVAHVFRESSVVDLILRITTPKALIIFLTPFIKILIYYCFINKFRHNFIKYSCILHYMGKNCKPWWYIHKNMAMIRSSTIAIIKLIDRLGRDYNMIIEERHYITKIIEADILVINMSLLDTRNAATNLIGKFISDIVLQILSFVAETEIENIKQRQAERIRLAKERGVHMGRPKYVLPNNFDAIGKLYLNKEITSNEAAKSLNMARSTFLKYVNLK